MGRPVAVPEIDPSNFDPIPECFDEEEWHGVVVQSRLANPWVSPRQFDREYVMNRACEDCTLAYQFLAKARGRCHPPAGAMTPIARAEAGINDFLDEPQRLAMQRA